MLIILVSFLMAGCLTGRSRIDLEIPDVTKGVQTNGKKVFIRSVVDARTFQDNPRDPSNPSLGNGGLAIASQAVKDSAIARQRNAFGKALGDIVLKNNKTVKDVIYEVTKNSLLSLGYDVLKEDSVLNGDELQVDVVIDKFWGWFTPGAWAVTLRSQIETRQSIMEPTGGVRSFNLENQSINICQGATKRNWKKVFDKNLKEYSEKIKTKF